MGFPIQKSPGHSPFADSPEHIAGYHVFHRLSMPRHPPHTLSNLTTIIDHRRPPNARRPSAGKLLPLRSSPHWALSPGGGNGRHDPRAKIRGPTPDQQRPLSSPKRCSTRSNPLDRHGTTPLPIQAFGSRDKIFSCPTSRWTSKPCASSFTCQRARRPAGFPAGYRPA